MFQTHKRAVLVGGGPIACIPELVKGLPIIAVDGGLDACLRNSLKPDYFLGDMEQETTDFEKALTHVDASGYVCFGFLDGRLDHTLATLHVVQKHIQKRPVLLYGLVDLILTASSDISVSLPIKERFSLWPLGEVRFKSSTGLLYPLTDIQMSQGSQIGTSNVTCEETVQIRVSEQNKGTYLVIISNRYFKELFMLSDASAVPK
jgi:thiamine pyrophosphokinase